MIATVKMNFSYKGHSYVAGETIEINSKEELAFLGNHVYIRDFRVPNTKVVTETKTKVAKRKIVKKRKSTK